MPAAAQEDRLLTAGGASTLSLPFAFYNSSFGAAAGYVRGETGWPDRDSALIATAVAGSQGSALAFLIGHNIHLPFEPRLMVDPVASVGYFNDVDSYSSRRPRLRDPTRRRQQF